MIGRMKDAEFTIKTNPRIFMSKDYDTEILPIASLTRACPEDNSHVDSRR